MRWAFMTIVTTTASMACAQGATWEIASTTGPSPRAFASMAAHPGSGKVVLFGGAGADGSAFGDTWLWNGAGWSPASVDGPGPRHGAGFVGDVFRDKTVLFGGAWMRTSGVEYRADTWEWDGSQWRSIGVIGPPARSEHAMCFDTTRGRCVLFGGASATVQFGDTWEFDGTGWERREPLGAPPPLSAAAMAYDERRQVAVLFGGYTGPRESAYRGQSSATYEYDGISWRAMNPGMSPPSDPYPAAYFDRGRNSVVVVSSGGTFAWDGNDWTQIAEAPGREQEATAYHAPTWSAVMFGGAFDGPEPGATMRLRSPCAIRSQPQDQTVDPGESVVFVVEVSASEACGRPVTYLWQRRNPAVANPFAPGAWIDLSDGSHYFGARTASLSIVAPLPALATGYRCRIGGGCDCLADSEFINTQTVNYGVACPADFNADGGIDFGDVEAFFERWENGC